MKEPSFGGILKQNKTEVNSSALMLDLIQSMLSVMSLSGLGEYLVRSGQWAEAELVFRRARDSARHKANKRDEGACLNNLGCVYQHQDRWTDAISVHEDALAIAAYLKSLPAVKNAVPGPYGPGETPSVMVSVIIPASVYVALPKPPAAK